MEKEGTPIKKEGTPIKIVLKPLDINNSKEVWEWGEMKYRGVYDHKDMAAASGLKDRYAENYTSEAALRHLGDPQYAQCFLKSKGKYLGIMEYRYTTSEVDKSAIIYLSMIYVQPKERGKGIGTKGIIELMEISKQAEARLELECWYENKAMSLYKRMGFKHIKSRLFLDY